MRDMEEWNLTGQGVSEDETLVGDMPNEAIMRPISKRVR
jgi:hypothetical protein